jgi:hypothetical protein
VWATENEAIRQGSQIGGCFVRRAQRLFLIVRQPGASSVPAGLLWLWGIDSRLGFECRTCFQCSWLDCGF